MDRALGHLLRKSAGRHYRMKKIAKEIHQEINVGYLISCNF